MLSKFNQDINYRGRNYCGLSPGVWSSGVLTATPLMCIWCKPPLPHCPVLFSQYCCDLHPAVETGDWSQVSNVTELSLVFFPYDHLLYFLGELGKVMKSRD